MESNNTQVKKPIAISRSWRTFGRQQAIGMLSLYKKIYMLDIEFHLNINGDIDQKWVDYVANFIPIEKIIFYKDDFFKEYAKLNKIDKKVINDFDKWKWIYHILLYHYLWKEKGFDYILTYDDDILFNSKEIPEIIDNLDNERPFGVSETNGWADKSMMGKLIIYFDKKGIDINYRFWGAWPHHVAINSGFLGMKMDFFEQYDSLSDIVNFFELKEYEHNDDFEWDALWKLLLQEQSFLVINQKSFYTHEFHSLQISDGYNLEWFDMDEFYPLRTKLEHYISTKKYTHFYRSRLDQEEERFNQLIEEGGRNIDRFYEN